MAHPPPRSTMPVPENRKPGLFPGERLVLEGQGGFLFAIRGWQVARFFLTDRRFILYVQPRVVTEVDLSSIFRLPEKRVHFAMKNRQALGIVFRSGPGQGGGRFWLCMNDLAAWKKAIHKGILENGGHGAKALGPAPA